MIDAIIAQLKRGECSDRKRHEAPCATCDAVDARIAWLRERVKLPVIATCAECKHCTAMGRPGARVPRRPLTEADLARIVAFYHCEHDDASPHRDNTGVARVLRNDPPPAWCPLRPVAP